MSLLSLIFLLLILDWREKRPSKLSLRSQISLKGRMGIPLVEMRNTGARTSLRMERRAQFCTSRRKSVLFVETSLEGDQAGAWDRGVTWTGTMSKPC